MLIYKSVREAIRVHEGKRLFCLPSLILGEETPRCVFVSDDLMTIVEARPGRIRVTDVGMLVYAHFSTGSVKAIGLPWRWTHLRNLGVQ
jgi:hypothetical protein